MATKSQAKKPASYASLMESLEKDVGDSEIRGYIKKAMNRVKTEKPPLSSGLPEEAGKQYIEGREIIYGDQLFKKAVKMYRQAEQEAGKEKKEPTEDCKNILRLSGHDRFDEILRTGLWNKLFKGRGCCQKACREDPEIPFRKQFPEKGPSFRTQELP